MIKIELLIKTIETHLKLVLIAMNLVKFLSKSLKATGDTHDNW